MVNNQCRVVGFCLDPRINTYKEGVCLRTRSDEANMQEVAYLSIGSDKESKQEMRVCLSIVSEEANIHEKGLSKNWI